MRVGPLEDTGADLIMTRWLARSQGASEWLGSYRQVGSSTASSLAQLRLPGPLLGRQRGWSRAPSSN